MLTSDSREQKAIGRTVKNFDADKWSAVSRDFVYQGNYAKFTQNPALLKQLLATGNKEFCEASPQDSIWGIGLHETDPLAWEKETWKGLNWLGQTITKVRNDISKSYSDAIDTMKFRTLKDWVNSIPDEFLDCDVVCSMEFELNGNEDVRVDRQVVGLAIDPDTREILVKIEHNEELDKV